MRNGEEIVGNRPEVLFGCHPLDAVEAAEIYRARIGPQRFFAIRIVIVLEIGHGQFAQAAIDRLAEAKTGVVGLGDSAPAVALPEEREHVIVVADGFQIEQEGFESLDTERGGAEEGAFQALGRAVAEDSAGAAAGGAFGLLVVGQVVEKALDALGIGEATEKGQLASMESVGEQVLILQEALEEPLPAVAARHGRVEALLRGR